MATLTKKTATPHSLKFELNESINPTGVATLAAATMLAQAAAGPLKEWIRKHYQEANATWSAENYTGDVTVTVTPIPDASNNDNPPRASVEFGNVGGVNALRASIAGIGACGIGVAVVEVRFNHTLVR